ncbi:MAG: chromosome segregation protein SMC [Methylococcaceae bacterium]
MKLEKIKLSGFKSFVDPTSIPIASNLTAVVGPNGCGKSNIIDAIRWVMGESSAKNLRGGSMADVIFNGSASRKPVSTAAVELVFDNSAGTLGGEYSQYQSISLKRQASRDGQSSYYLNGSRCRRKDIVDLFLGTGLGARSYAIIEQGMISRLVEAKPDDLRVHIEEAAGISKYKERRQETETRMRHTRENLDRLQDLQDEVEKQVHTLKKQAEKAEKYTELKKQERRLRLELLAMRWTKYQRKWEQLNDETKQLSTEHNELFVKLKEVEKNKETESSKNKILQDELNSTQAKYYEAVTEINRVEQTIEHNRQNHQQITSEIRRLEEEASQAEQGLQEEQNQHQTIQTSLQEATATLKTSQQQEREALEIQQKIQAEKSAWQIEWESYGKQSSQYNRQLEVQIERLNQLKLQNQQLMIRQERLKLELNGIADHSNEQAVNKLQFSIAELEGKHTDVHQRSDQINQTIQSKRLDIKLKHETLNQIRSELHGLEGRVASLELLQKHAMGRDNSTLTEWLLNTGLDQNQRLAEKMNVEKGWETAVEIVLGTFLEAICVDDSGPLFASLTSLQGQSLALVENYQAEQNISTQQTGQLIEKIKTTLNLSGLLQGVYFATDIIQAKQQLNNLKEFESIITAEGEWLGPGWIKICRLEDGKSGILQRKNELADLTIKQQALIESISLDEGALAMVEKGVHSDEQLRDDLRQQEKESAAALSVEKSELSAHKASLEQQKKRSMQITEELSEIDQMYAENAASINETETIKEELTKNLAALEQQSVQLQQSNQGLDEKLEQADIKLDELRRQVHGLQTQVQTFQSSSSLTQKQLERLQQNHQKITDRIEFLQVKRTEENTPTNDEQAKLEAELANKKRLDEDLQKKRFQMQATEKEVSQLMEKQTTLTLETDKKKSRLEKLRFEQQESQVRQQTITEQLNEIDSNVEDVLKNIPTASDEATWKQNLDKLVSDIEKLGTINLTAVEDFQSQSERLNFLNEQHQDLIQSLDVLDQAINKIDQESKTRFKETFDKINAGLQEKFPKLFGGGEAYLELMDQDLLETGVGIIARPPGKRNSSIHLLSGGEKALTAVALVFSIFELNPAPFCLLDEVDAPLDDANVGRFSTMVAEMSEAVQFLFITHNKVTMEIARQLTGVTMKEPGVSRMVAVDIEEAVQLVAS